MSENILDQITNATPTENVAEASPTKTTMLNQMLTPPTERVEGGSNSFKPLAFLKTNNDKTLGKNCYELAIEGRTEEMAALQKKSKKVVGIEEISILKTDIEFTASAKILSFQPEIWQKNTYSSVSDTEHFHIFRIKPTIQLNAEQIRPIKDLADDKSKEEKDLSLKSAAERIAKFKDGCNFMFSPVLLEMVYEPKFYKESDFTSEFKKSIVDKGFGLYEILLNGEKNFVKYIKIKNHDVSTPADKIETHFKGALSIYKWIGSNMIPIYNQINGDIICKTMNGNYADNKVRLISAIISELEKVLVATIKNELPKEKIVDTKTAIKTTLKEVVLKDCKETPITIDVQKTQLGFIGFKVKPL